MSKVSLYNVLKEIGFREISDSKFEYDFGNFKLNTCEGVNKHLADIFYFSGINRTPQTITLIEFDLPIRVDSVEQGVAFLSYYLGKDFEARKVPAWYHQGKLWKYLLPWEKERTAYNQKPSATIEHEYFRLMIRKMRKLALLANMEDITTFSFDGEILKIVCADQRIVAPATGNPWEETITVRTKSLSNLPERVKTRDGEMFLWQECLQIASNTFKIINLSSSDIL